MHDRTLSHDMLEMAELMEIIALKDKEILALRNQVKLLHAHWERRVPFPDIIGNFNPRK
jgi:hypothetical protein